MNIFENLANMFGANSQPAGAGAGAGLGSAFGAPRSGARSGGGMMPRTGASAGGGLADILNSGGLGDIAKNVLTNRKGDFSWLKGALLAGAGSMLWNRLTERVQEANPKYAAPSAASAPSTATGAAADEQAGRLIRALVYAAKADGHIDEQEKAAINNHIGSMNIGREGAALVQQAMKEPLDPQRIAQGVSDPREALQLYTLSRAVINPDQFMEKNYLDALAHALNIPPDVQQEVDMQIRKSGR